MTRTIGAAREACHHDPQATMRSYTAGLEAVLAGFGALGARDELPRLFVEMAQKGMAAGLEDKGAHRRDRRDGARGRRVTDGPLAAGANGSDPP